MESVRFPTVFDKVDVNLHETVQFLSNQGVKVTICNEQPNKWKEKVIFPDKGKEKVMFSESNNGEETARWLEKEKQKAIYSEIQKLKRDIKEKRRQIKVLEKYMIECGEASVANASSVDMQQTSANDHILDEQLQDKLNDEKEKSSSLDEGKEKDISSEDTNAGNANSVSKRSVAQRIRRERERSEGIIHAPRRPSKFFPSLTPSRRVIAQRRRFEMAREAAKRAKLHDEIEKEAPNNEETTSQFLKPLKLYPEAVEVPEGTRVLELTDAFTSFQT